jgi:UDP-N-acetylmuramoyl-L-alanyl-D-glutamate--2,6-diaminopimelate ligase
MEGFGVKLCVRTLFIFKYRTAVVMKSRKVRANKEMESETKNIVKLATVINEFPLKLLRGNPGNTLITGIAIDNRLVQPGDLFVALKGSSADGHQYIPDAIRRGAAAVVGDITLTGLTVPYIQVENSRQALTWLAAAFYGNPGRKLTVIGVTGTDGKTTTCNLLYQILLRAGYKTGLISTVNAVIGDEVLDTGFHVTTPDAPDVQRYLARMVAAGLTHVVLETTSHGWAQYRVDACEFDIGVVTNITHEHLDQHGSYENYLGSKARLFQSLSKTLPKEQGNPRLAVLNRDDSSYTPLRRLASEPIISYGLNAASSVRAEAIEYSAKGIRFRAIGPDFQVEVNSPLVGEYNVSNCLAALSAGVRGIGVSPKIAAEGIAELKSVPGRNEVIDLGQNFWAIVDFAHTPNALRVAIEAVRKMTQKRVIVIFGSAGLRDREKRRMMAEVALEMADVSILTAEDPRTESLDGILEEMAAGARSRGGVEEKSFWRVPDRGEAIRFGVHMAHPGDIVMACGKGHEQSMCFETTEYPWDDRTAMRAALAELLGLPGPKMPSLPTSKP